MGLSSDTYSVAVKNRSKSVAVGGDVEILGDQHGGVNLSRDTSSMRGPGWARAQVANTWRREWNVHAHLPTGLWGQPAATAAGSKGLRR